MASRVPIAVPPQDELRRKYFQEGHTYQSLGALYGASPATVAKWFKDYRINVRLKFGIITIGGVQHKRCTGRTHPKGGELIPISKFWKNIGKRNNLAARCVDCMKAKQRVPFVKYKVWVTSIYRRLGYMETVRRLEINTRTLTQWLGKDQRPAPLTITRDNAIKIARVMMELRETGEVRHRKSIHRGAKVRGEIERPVIQQRDLLVPHGDQEAEYRRRLRKRNAA